MRVSLCQEFTMQIPTDRSPYHPYLKPLSKKSRNASALIFQRSESILKQYVTALKNGHKSSDAIRASFTQPSTKYQVTPLHVAAITGQVEIARNLIEFGHVDVNAEDIHGWTPLHHAVVIKNARMINLLQKYGAKDGVVNDRNGSPLDFHEMIHAETKPLDQPILEMDSSGSFVKMSRKSFKALTGSIFIDRMKVPPSLLIDDWGLVSHDEAFYNYDCQVNNRKRYETFLNSAVKVALQRTTIDEGGTERPIGATIVAACDIEPGAMICDYLGEYTDSENSEVGKEDYRLGRVDGARFRNLGPIAQDGFPNAFGSAVINIKGLPHVSILVATSKIKKGEPVVWDYSTHPVKFFGIDGLAGVPSMGYRYYELRPLAASRFIQNLDIVPFLLKFKHFISNGEVPVEDFDAYPVLDQLLYFLNTPVVFMKHALLGHFDVDDFNGLRTSSLIEVTNFGRIPENFQAEPIRTLMQDPDQFQILRQYLLTHLELGNSLIPQNILFQVSQNIDRFRDPKDHPPENFSYVYELAKEFFLAGKDVLCLELIDIFFGQYEWVSTLTKEELRGMMIKAEPIFKKRCQVACHLVT